jgi:hypothetical protein
MLCKPGHPLQVEPGPDLHTGVEEVAAAGRPVVGVPGIPVQALDTRAEVPETVSDRAAREPGLQLPVPGGHPRFLHHSSRRTSHQVRVGYHRYGSSALRTAGLPVQR